MIAYNKQWLHNLSLQEYCNQAHAAGVIDKKEEAKIKSAYPVHFYSPGLLLRIGLALLTLLVSAAICGILVLLASEQYNIICLIMGILSLVALEMAVKKWNHYQSGIDDMLLHTGILYLCLGFSLNSSIASDTLMAGIAFFLYSLALIRYLDRFSILLGLGALIWFIYSVLENFIIQPNAWVLLLIAGALLIVFLLAYKLQKRPALSLYNKNLQLLKYSAIIGCYGSLHHYFVTDYMGPSGPVFFTWLTWIWTISVPLLFLIVGIRISQRPWIRIGLGSIVLLLFYIQVQYTPIPQDIAAILYGVILICIAWWAIQFLKTVSTKFTNEPDSFDLQGLQLETMAIGIGFSPVAGNAGNQARTGTEFGGGDFGGGGAGAQF